MDTASPVPPRPYTTAPSLMDRRTGSLLALVDPDLEGPFLRRVRDLRAENVRLGRQVESLESRNRELTGQVEALTVERSQLQWALAEAREREAGRFPGRGSAAAVPGEDFLALLEEGMARLLGPTGPALVHRVCGRLGLPPGPLGREDAGRVLERLREVAPRLFRGPDAAERVDAEVALLRTRLEEEVPAQAEALPVESPEPLEPVSAEPPAPVSVPEPVSAEPPAPAAAPEPDLAEPVPTVEVSLPAPALPEEEAPRPEVPEEEPQAGPAAPAEPLEPAPTGLKPCGDAALLAELEVIRVQTMAGDAEEALDRLLTLDARLPDCLEVQSALFEFFCSFECWAEAHEVARRLKPVLLRSAEADSFRDRLSVVLERRVAATRDPVEKKEHLLDLAEMHLQDPPAATAYLQRARLLPEKHPREGYIDKYLVILEVGMPEERRRNLHGWMNRVADSADLFDHLRRTYGFARFREIAAVPRVILALATEGRRAAESLEGSKEYRKLLPQGSQPAQFYSTYVDSRESSLLSRILDDLLPRTGLDLSFPSPEDQSRLAASVPALPTWEPARTASELRQQVFGGEEVRVLRYEGPEALLVHIVPGPSPALLLSPRVEGVPSGDLRALVAGAFYRLRRRHGEFQRLVDCLDSQMQARLVAAALGALHESGGTVPEELERRVRDLDSTVPERAVLVDLVQRLYDYSRNENFRLVLRLLSEERPFAEDFDRAADQFTALVAGPTAASFGLALQHLGPGPLLERCSAEGFAVLYDQAGPEMEDLRLRLQRTWLGPLRALR